MAKQSGLGDNLYVAGYDLSGDINSLGSISGGPAVLDVTAINASAMERIGGVRDGQMEFTSFFNPASGAAHETFSALPTTDAIVTYCRGTSLGSPTASLVGKQINYDGNRANDGAFTFTVQAQANGYGVEWGTLATAGKRSDTGATSGTSIDLGAALTEGFQAYLHVFSFTGTSCTVKFQTSDDDGDSDAFTDLSGATFGAQNAVGAKRIAVSGAVEQYIRITTTGTFSECTFAVSLVLNEVPGEV